MASADVFWSFSGGFPRRLEPVDWNDHEAAASGVEDFCGAFLNGSLEARGDGEPGGEASHPVP